MPVDQEHAEPQHAHLTEATPADFKQKGLKKDVIGLPGSVTLAVASTAPAFSLAVTVGFLAIAVGTQAPAVLLVAFVPMIFVAIAYRELNRVMPDAGTSFTWGTKAFGPWIGWLGGWGLAATGIIFVANAADVVGNYTVTLFNHPELENNRLVIASIGVAFIILLTWITYRGLEGSTKLQYFLVGLQFVVLIAIAVAGFWAFSKGNGLEGSSAFQWSWLNPLKIDGWGPFAEGFLLAVFIYWGFDTALSVNEETSNSTKTPGRAAVIATVLLVAIYLIVTISMVSYAGIQDAGMGSEDNANDIFSVVAQPLFGPWGTPVVVLTVLLSTAASLQTTIMPTTRSALAMAVYKAAPKKLATISPKFLTPSFATVLMGTVGAVFYVGLKFLSNDILQDTILSIGLGICLYYGVTAFSCVWWFRKEAFTSVHRFFFMFLFPLLGGLILAAAFVKSAIDMWDPAYGTTSLGNVGGVFIMGVGSLLVGVVLMIAYSFKAPAFFRGKTLHKDTPILVPED